MSIQIGTLLIELGANVARLTEDMDRATKVVGSSMRSVQQVVGETKTVLAELGIGFGVGYFVDLVKHSIEASDHLQNLSMSTSIAVEQLAGLRLVAKISGSDIDGMALSINRLSVNMGKAPERFAALGVSAKDPLEAFKQLSDIFTKLQDPEQRAAVMAESLGKAWAAAAPTLAMGGHKIGEMVEKGARLSSVTAESAKAAQEFNEKWIMLTGTGGMLTRVVTPLLPLLTLMADDMLKAQEKTTGLTSSISPLLEIMKVLVVAGAEVSFTFQTIGKDIARAFENVQLIAKGDFAGSRALGEVFRHNAADARKALDEYTKSIMALGKTSPTTATDAVRGKSGNAGNADAANRAANFLGVSKDLSFTRLADELSRAYAEADIKQKAAAQEMLADYFNLSKNELIELAKLADEVGKSYATADEKQLAAGADVLYNFRIEENRRLGVLDDMQKRDRLLQILDGMRSQRTIEDQDWIEKQQLLQERYQEDYDNRTFWYAKLLQLDREHNRKIIELDKSFQGGANQGLLEVFDAASNHAAQARDLTVSSFKSMEDALVNFTKTGKLDFKSLADSIITDLIRIQIKNSIIAPLSASMGTSNLVQLGLSYLSGSGEASSGSTASTFNSAMYIQPRAGGGDISANLPYWVGEQGPELVVPRSSGTVIPNGAIPNGAMGGNDVSIVNHYHIDARSDIATIMQVSEQSRRQAVADVEQSLSRGGRLAKLVGIARG